MKIALISPSIKQSASANYPDGIPRSISQNFGVYPWLGLCYLAGVLEKTGFDSEIIDMDAESFRVSDVIKRLFEIKPSLVGISTISFTFIFALQLAQEIKKHFDIPVIFGGNHVSIYPKEVVMHDAIDIGVVGEGEETFLKLVSTFQEYGRNFLGHLKEIDGLVFKKDGETITTNPRKFIKDIDRLPFPAVHKLRINRYYGCNQVKPYVTMVTARGCPFSCSFCSKEPWGDTFRFHSAERVVDEIEYYIKNLGIRAIDFYDDTFTVPRSRTIAITNLIKRRNIKFDFGLMTRIDCVDEELLFKLKEAGCKFLAYGVESGDRKVQGKVNKVFNNEDIAAAFRISKKAGIRTVGFFMIGYPEETQEEIDNTIKLMKGLDADYMKTNIFIPYPGSQLYNQLLSTQKLRTDFWLELTKGKIPPIRELIKTKVSISRLVKLRNYMNRLPYLRLRGSNFLKINKIKSFEDIKRSLAIMLGSCCDRKI